MKKVAVMVVDTKTGVSQFGVIEEPVTEGFEVENALKHFGVSMRTIEWYQQITDGDINIKLMDGFVTGTSKVVSIVICV